MSHIMYNLLVGILSTSVVCLIIWLLFKLIVVVIKALGFESFLNQPKCIISLYALLAVFILINFIGLINAINYLINTDIQNIKNLAEFLLKKILLLFSAFTVMYFTIKNREIGQWLAAAFVAGIIIWFAMHELNSIPGEFKRPLFKHKNPEMAALGSISFSASFFAVLLLLLVNIIFSKSAIAHFRKSGEENV